jgi:hypothetical protein
MGGYNFNFPAQKKSYNQKGKTWRKKCVNALDTAGYFNSENIRKTFREKLTNYNLYNGILDVSDMKGILNPEDIKSLTDSDSPPSVPLYGISAPRIDVLTGEEAKRDFQFNVVVINPLAISSKAEKKKEFLFESLRAWIESEEQDEEKLKQKLADLQEDYTYSYQDVKEVTANRLLNYLYAKDRLALEFNDGFKDALIASEEIYQVEIVADEPVLKRVNPLHVHWLRSGFSSRIEDADLIVTDEYWSPGQIIDYFHDELKSADVSKLEKGLQSGGGGDPFVGNRQAEPLFVGSEILEGNIIDDQIGLIEVNGAKINRAYDINGNIRVLRVYWRSFKKVLKVKSYDPNTGLEVYNIRDEFYQIKEDEGETAETMWINEWWEGTKVGEDIYVKMRPKQVQYRHPDNPSICYPGFVGGAYAVNNTKGRSLMDRMKNFEYLYSAVHDRLNKYIAKNKGKILQMDLSQVPRGWKVEQWLHYIEKMGVAVVDSFKEGNKGASTGRLAGSLNNASKGYIDLETGQNIQQHIYLLEFIKNEMSELSGVSDQRLGQTQSRETVGGIERSISQSNHITEWYFTTHEDIKLRAMEALLETAKIAYKGRNISKQYVLDDMSIQMLSFDGSEFAESTYGLVVTSSAKYNQLSQKIERLAELGLQSSAMSFNTAMEIYMSDSMAEKRRVVRNNEEANRQAQAQESEAAAKQAAEAKAQETALKNRELDIKEFEAQSKALNDANNGDAISKLILDKQRRDDDVRKFEETLAENKRQFNEKLDLDKKKVAKMGNGGSKN